MDITITPHTLTGKVDIIPSKSQAHRLLICSAFADKPTFLQCKETNRDIEATAGCLRALGADVVRTDFGYRISPIFAIPTTAVLNCQDSGSTLRFMLPIVGALGVDTTFLMEGRLPHRPLSPLWEEMERMGCSLSRPTENTLRCSGKLRAGNYSIDGGVSSQFITGLMFAISLLDGKSTLAVTGKIESKPYIELTRNAMLLFGVDPDHPCGKQYITKGNISVEGDWSNAAFFLAANFIGNKIDVNGLDYNSLQGDRAVIEILNKFNHGCPTISAADVPDLIPILSIAAACANGAVFTDVARLRLKESDRVASVCAMLHALGCCAEAEENILRIFPGTIRGGTVDSYGDHRIVMSAAIAATVATDIVTILGAECAAKSYPKFWDVIRQLGGSYEQYLR